MAKYPLHPKAIEHSKEKNTIFKNDFSMLYQNPKALICRDCEECSAYKKNLGQTSIQFQKNEYCHVTKDLIKDAIKKPCPKENF